MSSDEVYLAAEICKNEGNQLYGQHRLEAALGKYQEGLKLLDDNNNDITTTALEDWKKLNAVIHSNMAQVHWDVKNYKESAKSGLLATMTCPKYVKGWLRYLRALNELGACFQAFVLMHQPVLPLLEEQEGGKALQVLQGLDDDIHNRVHLMDVNPNFRIVTHAGGMGSVMCNPVEANKILFVERGLRLAVKAPDAGMLSSQDMTSENLVLYFLQQLVDLKNDTEREKIRLQFEGSWPRSMKDLPNPVVSHFFDLSSDVLDEVSDHHQKETLLQLALQLRYNCFYSGFFRVCALINHSCHPNAAMKHAPQANEVSLLACSDIPAGGIVSVKYLTDADYILGVIPRRRLLFHSWLFWCDCPRCAQELQPSATCEHIRCTKCKKFLFLPGPPKTHVRASVSPFANDVDPALKTEAICSSCGEKRTWSPEEVQQCNTTIEEVSAMLGSQQQQSIFSCYQLADDCLSYISKLDWCHDDHWLFRIIIYSFCVCAQSDVSQQCGLVLAGDWEGLRQECSGVTMSEGLHAIQTGETRHPKKDEEGGRRTLVTTGGGLPLNWFCELWRRIESFYPAHQAWVVHQSISRIASCSWIMTALEIPFALTIFAHLSFDEYTQMLIKHTVFLSQQERKELLRSVQTRIGKKFEKEMNRLKQILK